MKEADHISSFFGEDIDTAVHHLQEGNIILCPTDTIWGLSCDPLKKESYLRIQKIKKRATDKPLILLASSIEMLKEYVDRIPPRIENLLVYFDHPVTIIYPEAHNLPEHCLSKDGSVAIRVSKEPFSKKLIERFGRPITSTSPNLSGQPYPSHFGEISSDIFDRVDYIVRYGRNKTTGTPSQIFRFDKGGHLKYLRE